MNKFEQLISTTRGALARRAHNVSTAAEIAQQDLLNKLRIEKTQLEAKLMNLTDLAPDNSYSLNPATKDWDATKWAEELQDTKQKIYNITIKIRLAQETYNEYFSEIEEVNDSSSKKQRDSIC